MSNLKTVVLSLVFLIFALYLIKIFDIAYPLTIVSTSKTSELAVVGEAKIDVSPDTAYINLGINTSEKTVSQVREKIDKVNNNFVNEMKKLGIKKEQIKTINYSIYPNYDYNDGQKIVGYSGNTSLQIKVKDFNLINKVLEKAEGSGINQIGGVNFTIDKPEVYREKVRERAIENAKNQAQKLAKSLGIKLGKITNIVEATPQKPILTQKTIEVGGGADASSAFLEPGAETISTVVTLYFEKK
ncbi:MAG: SIMPL domain-containing protein [Microgenomates group bacterium]